MGTCGDRGADEVWYGQWCVTGIGHSYKSSDEVWCGLRYW